MCLVRCSRLSSVNDEDEAEERPRATPVLVLGLSSPAHPSSPLSQEGFSKFSRASREASLDSSMKTALFAAAGVGLAGLTFLLVR